MRLLYTGSGWLPIVDEIRSRLPEGVSIERWDRVQPLAEALEGIEVLLPSNFPITASVLDMGKSLRLIHQPAAGTDNIDLEGARARGIPVCNTPARNHIALAETALMLMLMLARRWKLTRKRFDEAVIGEPLGMELCGKTLGIVGMGRSGTALATTAEAMGMRVLGLRSSSTEAEWEQLLRSADVISLHCPLSPASVHLFDRRRFERCKAGALFINCARSGLVHEEALVWALDEGPIAGAAIDHHWKEPWEPSKALYHRQDVIATPHIGGSSREAFARVAECVVENVKAVRAGSELRHRMA